LPSMVHDINNPSKSYQIQISQEFWNDIKNKEKTFKDRIKTFQIIEQGGYKITPWNDENWDLAFVFGYSYLPHDEESWTDESWNDPTMIKKYGYSTLNNVDFSGLNIANISSLDNTFQNCYSLNTVNWNSEDIFINLETIFGIFSNCLNLSSIPTFNLGGKIDSMRASFQNCEKLTSITFTGLENCSSITSTKYAFNNCYSLREIIGLENVDFSNATDMSVMFQDTPNLQSIPVETWKIRKVEDFSWMFYNSGITKFDISQADWNLSSLTTTRSMFNKSKVSEVRFGQVGDTLGTVSIMQNMFEGTKNLKYVDTEKWKINSLSSARSLFINSDIEKIDLSTWNPIQTNIDMTYMFKGTNNLREVDMRGFTNLDSQNTTELLGTGQVANPIMLIVQDSPGNQTFRNRDFQKESGRIPMPMPLLKTSNEQLKLTDGSTESAYITTIPVVPSTLEKTSFDAWLQKQTPQSKVIGNNFYYVKDVTPSKDVSSATSVLDLLDVTYTVNVVESEWEFKYDNTDSTYELVQYLGTSPDIVVPNEIDGKPTKIDLSSGIKTPNLGDPKTTVTSITFDSSNGKKVKAIGSGIRFSDY
ncbi:BspA family leucine-rich repeat surface protein, partial [Enterococcus faecalis]|uniref:BspA family leucine-rich repeat surface protein n=1 Tax=Enterococcus faecalis TaxID=1351 RepID=UPI001A974D40